MIHGIRTFLDDKTVCGKPIEKEHRPNSPYPEDWIIKNIALELDAMTCPECRHKLEVAHATA